jgi:hypothetical protein
MDEPLFRCLGDATVRRVPQTRAAVLDMPPNRFPGLPPSVDMRQPLLKIQERRAKLLRLDAPSKTRAEVIPKTRSKPRSRNCSGRSSSKNAPSVVYVAVRLRANSLVSCGSASAASSRGSRSGSRVIARKTSAPFTS